MPMSKLHSLKNMNIGSQQLIRNLSFQFMFRVDFDLILHFNGGYQYPLIVWRVVGVFSSPAFYPKALTLNPAPDFSENLKSTSPDRLTCTTWCFGLRMIAGNLFGASEPRTQNPNSKLQAPTLKPKPQLQTLNPEP